MTGLELVMWEDGEVIPFEQELKELGRMKGPGCRRDAASVAAALERWQEVGFRPSSTFDLTYRGQTLRAKALGGKIT